MDSISKRDCSGFFPSFSMRRKKFILINVYFEMCSNLALVRADVSRLPFSSGSVDAVHAGAALHCWPSPSNAVSIIAGTYYFDMFRMKVWTIKIMSNNGKVTIFLLL